MTLQHTNYIIEMSYREIYTRVCECTTTCILACGCAVSECVCIPVVYVCVCVCVYVTGQVSMDGCLHVCEFEQYFKSI